MTKKNILYVEDNPANLRLITQVMEKIQGVELISAHTPQLGLDLCDAKEMDLILLDINLPGMNGFEMLEKLRSMNQYKDVPILAVSANAMPGDIAKGKEAGFDEYITKPINIQNFIQTVKEYLKLN
ncbi:MAG: response regulator [Spirochaetia bacterium]|nr:response regulator [Spirochaetia bacterium]